MRRLPLAVLAILATCVLAACTSSPTPSRHEAAAAACTRQSVPVNLDSPDAAVYQIAGWLCVPDHDGPRSRTVQLLVSGLTYAHSYWDTNYQPDTYSYVLAANERGYATFNVDRIGIGESDHPPAEKLTLQAHAHTIGQIVHKLRDGEIGGIAFETVVGVGHSLGAGILQYEAGTVTDRNRVPDLLILTGYLTKTNPDVVAAIGKALYPAAEDAVLAGTRLPAGYLTTRPGTRTIFVAPGDIDPAITATDEAGKQTSSMAERSTVSAARDPHIMQAISVPVLLVVGQHDQLGCDDSRGLSCADANAILSRESPNFSASACLQAYVLPDAGHAINMQRNAAASYTYGNDWLDEHIVPTQRPIGDTCRKPATP